MRSPSEVYRAYVEAEARRDEVALRALLAPDIHIEVDGQAAFGSAEEDADAMAALFAAYPDYRREIIDLIEEGDRLAARWRMRGRPRPDLTDRLPTIDIRGVSVVTVVDGRLSEAYVWSQAGALERILDLLEQLAADG